MNEEIKEQDEELIPTCQEEGDEPVITISKALEICQGKIAEKQAEVDAEHDKYVRAVADYENLKRHSAESLANAKYAALTSILKDILPIIDNFERAFEHGDLSEGGKLIYHDFLDFLYKQGIEEINPQEGDDFTCDFHTAVSALKVDGKESGKIMNTIQKGYRCGKSIIRYASVVVYA